MTEAVERAIILLDDEEYAKLQEDATQQMQSGTKSDNYRSGVRAPGYIRLGRETADLANFICDRENPEWRAFCNRTVSYGQGP